MSPPGTTGAAQPAAVPAPSEAIQNGDVRAPAGDGDGVFVFKKQVEEVVLHATVVDERRRLVTNLGRNTFSVFENGVPQTVTSFHREDVPVAMGILIDNSGSMREKREQVNQAVLNLIRASNPNDETFVVNFSNDPYLDQDFTSDIGLLQQALQKVSMQGTTALYDAVIASAEHLKNNTRVERKILLVITDGQDNASRGTLQEAAQRLQQENGATLYAIGLLEECRRQWAGKLWRRSRIAPAEWHSFLRVSVIWAISVKPWPATFAVSTPSAISPLALNRTPGTAPSRSKRGREATAN